MVLFVKACVGEGLLRKLPSLSIPLYPALGPGARVLEVWQVWEEGTAGQEESAQGRGILLTAKP